MPEESLTCHADAQEEVAVPGKGLRWRQKSVAARHQASIAKTRMEPASVLQVTRCSLGVVHQGCRGICSFARRKTHETAGEQQHLRAGRIAHLRQQP